MACPSLMIIPVVIIRDRPGTMAGGYSAGTIVIWSIGQVGHICIDKDLYSN